MKRVFALVLISLPASAQWQGIFLSTQLVSESSKISISLSQAERAAARDKRARQRDEPEDLVVECQTHVDCDGYCIKGRCVDAVEESAQVEPTPEPPRQPALDPPNVMRCSAEVSCAEGQSCMNGFCMSPPPPPSSLLRKGTEVYVRMNVRQLKQDLALGEGPVISTLARFRGVSAKELGPLMRAHRGELAQTLGDPADNSWPGRFLSRLDALSSSTQRVALLRRSR